MESDEDKTTFDEQIPINWDEFERDFCVACNMMLGQSYEQAQISAKEWVEDSK